MMAIPNTIIYFTLYDQLKMMYGFSEGNFWAPPLAGITARSKVAHLITNIMTAVFVF